MYPLTCTEDHKPIRPIPVRLVPGCIGLDLRDDGTCHKGDRTHVYNRYEADRMIASGKWAEPCGYRMFGMMPACVLHKGHNGEHKDGFGGHYGKAGA